MTFGLTPKDGGGIPLSSAVVPGQQTPVPVGGTGVFTDGNNNEYTPVAVGDLEQAGYIALVSPPTATNAGSQTVLTFAQPVNRVIMQNNGSQTVNYAFDATASAGSLALLPGSFLIYPKIVTAVHVYTASAMNINGTSAANLVLLGAM
jgi:hypothetical protein